MIYFQDSIWQWSVILDPTFPLQNKGYCMISIFNCFYTFQNYSIHTKIVMVPLVENYVKRTATKIGCGAFDQPDL